MLPFSRMQPNRVSVIFGAVLLFIYGVGSGVPAVLVGTTAGLLVTKLENTGYGLWAERISGSALLAFGLFLIWEA